jgi:hypothetical protein
LAERIASGAISAGENDLVGDSPHREYRGVRVAQAKPMPTVTRDFPVTAVSGDLTVVSSDYAWTL